MPGALTDDVCQVIQDLRARATDALNEPLEPCFVHYDFKLGNTNVVAETSGYQVSGIFDFMTAASGDGEQDFSRILCEFQRYGESVVNVFLNRYRVFLNRYRSHHKLRPGYFERFGAYLLMDRLILWAYGKGNNIWFDRDLKFYQFLKPYLAMRELLQ